MSEIIEYNDKVIRSSRPPCSGDERIAMKMLVRYKQLRRASPEKPGPDIGWMQELLQVVREME